MGSKLSFPFTQKNVESHMHSSQCNLEIIPRTNHSNRSSSSYARLQWQVMMFACTAAETHILNSREQCSKTDPEWHTTKNGIEGCSLL